MDELRFRQIHLDFHTSPLIRGVGERFDPEQFASTLAQARVNSVTCFARCHHGYIYYDTRAFPQRRHPHLTRNLLAEQIHACHARGIRVPIYTSVQWDHLTAEEHPEWLQLSDQGAAVGTRPYEPGFYRRLCLNTPYLDFLKAHVREFLELLPTDGIFFDIVGAQDCSCPACRGEMDRRSLDPSAPAARREFGLEVMHRFQRDMTAFVRRFNRECTIFYNTGHVGTIHRAVTGEFTHWELESLPSGGWGYMHFPLTQRYARTLGPECLGMTGKFHTSWGDFHSYKNAAALEFECFQMLALGAKCSVGDQLHPDGKIDPATYELVGSVYRQVEEKEPWCRRARPVTEIGVLTPEEFLGGSFSGLPPAAIGAARMLQELAQQFDVLDSRSDFSQYRLLVLPDEIPCAPELAEKMGQFLTAGGAVVASYHSGLNEKLDAFAVTGLGVELRGDAPFSPDFLLPTGAIGRGLPATEHVMYLPGLEVAVRAGGEVLAEVVVPYFNRTWRHFCSHRHTPSSGKVGYPGIVRHGRAMYFAHPIFTQYHANAARWCKLLVGNALELLLPDPLLRLAAPTATLSAINAQPEENRWVLHLLHYVPERRGQAFDVIEDVVPIADVRVSVRAAGKVRRVACVPRGEALEFSQAGGRVEFVLPRLAGHQMVELTFAPGAA